MQWNKHNVMSDIHAVQSSGINICNVRHTGCTKHCNTHNVMSDIQAVHNSVINVMSDIQAIHSSGIDLM